jgi:hypothetical protein
MPMRRLAGFLEAVVGPCRELPALAAVAFPGAFPDEPGEPSEAEDLAELDCFAASAVMLMPAAHSAHVAMKILMAA